jgi:hypothetical protein
MNPGLRLALTLSAGLLGGLLSRYIAPPAVLAQAGPQKELRAQSFVLVDEKNNVVGIFKPSESQNGGFGTTPTVVLMDRSGREIWRAGLSTKVLSER